MFERAFRVEVENLRDDAARVLRRNRRAGAGSGCRRSETSAPNRAGSGRTCLADSARVSAGFAPAGGSRASRESARDSTRNPSGSSRTRCLARGRGCTRCLRRSARCPTGGRYSIVRTPTISMRGCSIVPSLRSRIVTACPRVAKSPARASPTGPAPTIKSGADTEVFPVTQTLSRTRGTSAIVLFLQTLGQGRRRYMNIRQELDAAPALVKLAAVALLTCMVLTAGVRPPRPPRRRRRWKTRSCGTPRPARAHTCSRRSTRGKRSTRAPRSRSSKATVRTFSSASTPKRARAVPWPTSSPPATKRCGSSSRPTG